MRNKTSLWLIAAVFAAAGFLITSCPEVVEALISLPLTGKVSIEGVPQVGETLTANTSELGGSGAISYQWNRMQGLNKVPIGGNSSTYIVQEEDVGSMINVTVSRFDNIGTVTNWQIVFVTSPLFNPRLNGSVSIEGTPEVGQTLTANTASLGGSGTISYQWKRNYITNVGTGVETYTLTSEDKLSVITVSVERKGNSGSVTSRQTSIITNPSDPRLTGTVSIEGTPEVGQTLTANTASLGGSGTISYQWKRGVDIGLNIGINTDNGVYVGENSSTYTVQKADLGYLITVTVTRANNSGTVTGSTTSVVKGEPLTILSGSVSITGDAEPGKTLTANTSSLGGSGTISYQWKRGVSTNIGVDSSTYIVQAGDVLSFITVTVTREGYYGSVTSVPAGPVTNPSLEPLTGTVSISGATQAGQTLTANTGSLGGSGDISYQWLKGVSGVGENRSTYILRNTDIGSVISVKVTRAGNSGFITSTATGIVTPDISHLPYFYTGTGKTYNGYAGGETGVQNLGGGLTITYPLNTTFEADAFFTLEGSVSNPGAYNYALISVWKDDGGSGGYQYLVNGDFKQQRIWLRNGPGEYSVYVSGLSSISLTGGGLPQSWSVATGEVSYKVTNTRNEDGRFIYPSPICMSDDPMITSLVTELTLGKTTERDKIKAIHDYMALNIAYDHASCVDGQRKRQDSVGVLGTKYTTNNIFPNGHYYAVCEGFANVFAALARAAGFQAKYISSGEMNHGWNQVYVDGAWRFMDVTWDGSQSWPITGEVNYDYYLLDEPENVHPGHWSVPGTTNAKPDPGRSVKVFGPLQNGVVEDW